MFGRGGRRSRWVRAWWGAALALVAVASLPAQRVVPGVVWLWSGGVTTTTAVVKARVRAATADLHLRYGKHASLEEFERLAPDTPLDGTGSGVAAFTLRDLSPDTRYYYAVTSGEAPALTGRFRTFPAGQASFAFAASACGGGSMFSAFSNSPIFRVIREREPLFFLHMGDLHYSNIGRNDVRAFRRAFDTVLTQPNQADLYRHVPIVYMWDDHDYGPNDSDRLSPARPAARTAYVENVPHYPLTARPGQTPATMQQEFTVGRVRFLVTDQRAERDPVSQPDGPGKSLLGAAQREWFEGALARAAADQAPLVVWVSPVPWITRQGDPQDGWQPYAWERRRLADRIEELGLTSRLIMLAGDAHMTAIDDGSNSNYTSGSRPGARAFPVFHAAPLDRNATVKGGPYSHGVSERSGQFGWVEVHDHGDHLTVTFTGHNSVGRELPGMRLKVVCRAGGCAPEP
jgi:alkaline phosphatase D